MPLATVYSPSGEPFEVTPKKSQELLSKGWTSAPSSVVVPEDATFEEKLELLDESGLHDLAQEEFGVLTDRRFGRDRLVKELKKLKALHDMKAQPQVPEGEGFPAHDEEADEDEEVEADE